MDPISQNSPGDQKYYTELTFYIKSDKTVQNDRGLLKYEIFFNGVLLDGFSILSKRD